ncbi:MAG TPA: DUF2946 family protein [Phenylobacterium sp.]|uniref:DUF2946 family protein n=1 Tax=Phenylobacterium sp. TaxID=1871053 RepID=UPI002B4A05FC|nr:DUF2946 family protein [Phenylobacterium sp.]HKR86783.1 DUF2946 family protein [Phenylobacterium sp.]
MRRGRDSKGRTGGRALVAAWVGVLALLVQALLPAAAMAAQAGTARGERIVVCTLAGARTVVVGEPDKSSLAKHGKGFAGLPCHDCLAAATAALPTPEPVIEPASFTISQGEHAPERSWAPRLARGPPRPPGQGPPQS